MLRRPEKVERGCEKERRDFAEEKSDLSSESSGSGECQVTGKRYPMNPRSTECLPREVFRSLGSTYSSQGLKRDEEKKKYHVHIRVIDVHRQ